jgi:hypothetical protein
MCPVTKLTMILHADTPRFISLIIFKISLQTVGSEKNICIRRRDTKAVYIIICSGNDNGSQFAACMLYERAGYLKPVRNACFAYAQNISWTVDTKYFKRY